MRFPFRAYTETEEEFQARIEQLHRDMSDLCRKQPHEVAGDPFESVYYSQKLCQALDSGDEAQARHSLHEMLRTAPTEPGPRLIASTAFAQLGDASESIAQLGIAVGLDPEFYPAHLRLARLLVIRGEREAAKALLDRGWVYYRKHVSKGDLDAKRTHYFSILDE